MPADLLLALALAPVLTTAAVVDIGRRVIPNRLTAAGALLALALVAVTRPAALPEHVGAAAGAAGFLLAAALARPGGMGMGDVKLAGVMGLFLGRAVVCALLVALVAAALAGVVLLARAGWARSRAATLPLGPYLAAGGLAGAVAGDDVVAWWVDP